MNKDELSKLRIAFAAFLEGERKTKGISRHQFAKALELDLRIIVDWESGKRPIDTAELRAYCRVIDLPLEKCTAFMDAAFEHLSDGSDGVIRPTKQ